MHSRYRPADRGTEFRASLRGAGFAGVARDRGEG